MGGPKALGPSLAQRLLGRPRKPAGWASVSPCPSLPPTPQGHSEMSFLQLSGAEVTPAQQITLKVEQCPPARQGQGWGQRVGGQHQAGWELLPGAPGAGSGRGVGPRGCRNGLGMVQERARAAGTHSAGRAWGLRSHPGGPSPLPLSEPGAARASSWQGEKASSGSRPLSPHSRGLLKENSFLSSACHPTPTPVLPGPPPTSLRHRCFRRGVTNSSEGARIRAFLLRTVGNMNLCDLGCAVGLWASLYPGRRPFFLMCVPER